MKAKFIKDFPAEVVFAAGHIFVVFIISNLGIEIGPFVQIILSFITILLGLWVMLSTLGHMLLVIFVALPITRALESLDLLKSFKTRDKKRDIIFDGYFTTPLRKTSLTIVLVSLIFFFFIGEFSQFLFWGYFLGFLLIIFNWFVRKLYVPNEDSYLRWYLPAHIDDIEPVEDITGLFNQISHLLKPESQRKIKAKIKNHGVHQK